MSKTLRFEGASDDIFGEYNVARDEFSSYGGKPIVWKATSGGQGLFITGQYSPNNSGCWMVGVEMIDEDKAPAWPMRLSLEGYSTILEIDVPDDIEVVCLERKSDD